MNQNGSKIHIHNSQRTELILFYQVAHFHHGKRGCDWLKLVGKLKNDHISRPMRVDPMLIFFLNRQDGECKFFFRDMTLFSPLSPHICCTWQLYQLFWTKPFIQSTEVDYSHCISLDIYGLSDLLWAGWSNLERNLLTGIGTSMDKKIWMNIQTIIYN